MDLHAAVMVSMLGVSRSRASAVFKELRQGDPAAQAADVLVALGVPRRGSGAARRHGAPVRGRGDCGGAAGRDGARCLVRSRLSRAAELHP